MKERGNWRRPKGAERQGKQLGQPMKERRNWRRPKGTKLLELLKNKIDAENDQFGRVALAEIKRLPTAAWEKMKALWIGLPKALPSTRKRILATFLEEALARQDPKHEHHCAELPAGFVHLFAEPACREIGAKAVVRSAVRNQEKLRAAAIYMARNPDAKLKDLAKAIPSVKKRTLKQWLRQWEEDLVKTKLTPENLFNKYLKDEDARIRANRDILARVEATRIEFMQSRKSRRKKARPKK
jgi:transposase-like protein